MSPVPKLLCLVEVDHQASRCQWRHLCRAQEHKIKIRKKESRLFSGHSLAVGKSNSAQHRRVYATPQPKAVCLEGNR